MVPQSTAADAVAVAAVAVAVLIDLASFIDDLAAAVAAGIATVVVNF